MFSKCKTFCLSIFKFFLAFLRDESSFLILTWNFAGKSDSGRYSGLSVEDWLYNSRNDIFELFICSPCPSHEWHYVRTLCPSWNIRKAWNSSKYFFPNKFWPKAGIRKGIFRDFLVVSKSWLQVKRDLLASCPYFLFWVFMFLYIQLLNFLVLDSFKNVVMLIQSCSNVHFKEFHLEVENTWNQKTEKI